MSPARAVLLHSFADRRTHEFLLDRDTPEPEQVRIGAIIRIILPLSLAGMLTVAIVANKNTSEDVIVFDSADTGIQLGENDDAHLGGRDDHGAAMSVVHGRTSRADGDCPVGFTRPT